MKAKNDRAGMGRPLRRAPYRAEGSGAEEGVMIGRKMKVAVVMPAYNTAHVLGKTCAAMPKELVDEIILVDDCSTDGTRAAAEALGLVVVSHTVNKGYGGAQKTGYTEALKRGADIVVLLHSDNQYDPSLLNRFILPIMNGEADLVTGSRIAYGDVLKDGMPIWKYLSNRFLTRLENIVLGTRLSDFHNGYRSYRAAFLREIPYGRFSDRYDFDTDIIIQAALRGYRIAEVPHQTRYLNENSKMSFTRGIVYGVSILKTLLFYLLHKTGIRRNELFGKAG
ncbi:MAG TPA: glycosyltransferase family 2 protein [bacterium]|nr:glycosyltransferase family 2 protein [bacterium]